MGSVGGAGGGGGGGKLDERVAGGLDWRLAGGGGWGLIGTGCPRGVKKVFDESRALSAVMALPVYPVFEDEMSNGSDEKSVKRKIA